MFFHSSFLFFKTNTFHISDPYHRNGKPRTVIARGSGYDFIGKNFCKVISVQLKDIFHVDFPAGIAVYFCKNGLVTRKGVLSADFTAGHQTKKRHGLGFHLSVRQLVGHLIGPVPACCYVDGYPHTMRVSYSFSGIWKQRHEVQCPRR